jgi:pilus assembly protein CpaB
MKQKFVLIAAIVFGIIAALLSKTWIDKRTREFNAMEERLRASSRKIKVVGAAKALPKGTIISEENIGALSVYEHGVRSHVIEYDDYIRIIGRRLVQSVDSHAPIFWSDIEGGNTGFRGLSADIRSEMRAVSIAVSGASAVSGMIRPNDTVDVLGTFVFSAADDPTASELVTRTVLQNVTVLATGSETAKTLNPLQRTAGGYSTVTLEVTPREAEVLVFAQQMKGRLTLTLRNPSDVKFEVELPRVDFQRIEAELRRLNEYRQTRIRGQVIENNAP